MKDRKNILFLAIGVLLSAVSKLLQFVYQSNIGDLVVLLAAVFFVLSILHSLTDFKALYHTAQGARQANLDGNPGLFGSGVISDYDDPDYWESQLDGVIAAGAFRSNGGTIWIQMVSKYCKAKKLTLANQIFRGV